MLRIAVMGAAGAALVLLSIRTAAAEELPRVGVGLHYHRDTALRRCPDESLFRRLLFGAFGYDPIDHVDDPRLVVSLTKEGDKVRADISIHSGGSIVWQDTRKQPIFECQDFVDSLAIATKIHLDRALAKPSPAAPALPERTIPANIKPPSPSTVTPPKAARNAQTSDGVELPSFVPASEAAPDGRVSDRGSLNRPTVPLKPWSGHVGVHSWGYFWGLSMPVAAVGASLGARWRFLSLTAEGRYYAPARDELHRVEAVGASLVPCAHYWLAHACLVGTMGLAWVEGAKTDGRATLAFAGGRLGADIPTWGPLFVRVDAEVSHRLTPYLVGHGNPAQEAPSKWTAGGGVGLLAHF